jgi:hypothetical protein
MRAVAMLRPVVGERRQLRKEPVEVEVRHVRLKIRIARRSEIVTAL